MTTRIQKCSRAEALTRLAQADAFLVAAELVLDDDTAAANAGVASSLAVLAGIAASDAACCARLGKRPRGQAHGEAVTMLESVIPGGKDMAKDLRRLLVKKGSSSYGFNFVTVGDAKALVTSASRLIGRARAAMEQ